MLPPHDFLKDTTLIEVFADFPNELLANFGRYRFAMFFSFSLLAEFFFGNLNWTIHYSWGGCVNQRLKDMGVEYVIESTGLFVEAEKVGQVEVIDG